MSNSNVSDFSFFGCSSICQLATLSHWVALPLQITCDFFLYLLRSHQVLKWQEFKVWVFFWVPTPQHKLNILDFELLCFLPVVVVLMQIFAQSPLLFFLNQECVCVCHLILCTCFYRRLRSCCRVCTKSEVYTYWYIRGDDPCDFKGAVHRLRRRLPRLAPQKRGLLLQVQ